MTPRACPTLKEIQIAILVWEGLTNREIGRIIGTREQVIKNHLRQHFRQAGGLEPLGISDVRRQARWKETGRSLTASRPPLIPAQSAPTKVVPKTTPEARGRHRQIPGSQLSPNSAIFF